MSKKVVSKGYTLEVVSWENDGDNYRTMSKTVDTKEEAIAIKSICNTLFRSSNNRDGGIGNLMSGEFDSAMPVIIEHVVATPEITKYAEMKPVSALLDLLKNKYSEDELGDDWGVFIGDFMSMTESSPELKLAEGWYDRMMDLNYELMGGSEYYLSRICESVTIYYSEKDIFLEEIK